MAKQDLLEEAWALGLDVNEENTVTEIQAALDEAEASEPEPASASTAGKVNDRGQALCPVCGRVANHVHASQLSP